MENSDLVLQDIEDFRSYVKNLSEKINKANVEWKDEKFKQLYKSIQEIANDSKELINAGEKCKKAIKNFSSYNNS